MTVDAERERAEKMIGKKSQPAIAWAAPPMFEYETCMYHVGLDLERLDRFINAKSLQGWRVHTCQRIGEEHFFLLFDRLRRQGER
jgi:hypothetical protein